ncbi:MAG: sodium-dependent dicarboxylate transporter 2/3/5 [Candidatus Krumholzibacteriia bacterium]|jgi:sodium-dependent dicarboxylate transporter 2/3/5
MSRQEIGLWLGPAAAIGMQLLPTPAGMAEPAWIVASMVLLMATWWVTEAVPIPVTSLIPLVVLPISGVAPIADAAGPYSSPIVLMLLGGFIIATSVERWQLHSRIALNIVVRAGSSPAGIVGGFMLASAVLSMWISNTATTIMLTPIAVSVSYAILGPSARNAPLTIAILLGLAYGSSIGGLATPIGTPTNLIVLGYLENEFGITIGFAQWMSIGLPVVAVMLPACWFTVTRLGLKLPTSGGSEGQLKIREALTKLGPMTVPERRVMITFAVIAAAWILRRPLNALEFGDIRPLAGMTDHVVAIAGVIALFLINAGDSNQPKERLLDWPTASRIPWGVLLLFGGGLSMAKSITTSGLAVWLGESLVSVTAWPLIFMIAVLVVFVIFATEVASNVATASSLLPVIGALALAGDVSPVLLSLPIAMAASCAFMLPIATGPNAIVFSTGEVTIPQMAKVGFLLNVMGVVLITLVIYVVAPFVVE